MNFPRFDDRRDGLPTRYIYCPTPLWGDGAKRFNALMRTDTQTGDADNLRVPGLRLSWVNRCLCQAPTAQHEDDGWVMAFVYHEADDSSDLALWDAKGID